jgi:hypothetical protein
MVSLKYILQEARSLSPAERAELIAQLLDQAGKELDAYETEVGHRGLAAWTESTRGESWEAFYPDGLRKANGTGS